MPERVVFDTNVIISGLLWRGKAYECLLLARSGVVQALYCPEMLAELSKKLRDKFDFSEDHIQAVVYEIRRFAKRVEISGTIRAVAADPDDDKFIECALVGKAKVIVSGNHHLLDLGQYEDIPIMNPAEFVAWIASHPITEEQSG